MQIQDPPPSAMPLRRLKTSSEQQQALKCPRCHSLNTKFCYFNNYNQSQPRHFCKSCRRYWTEGGALRNVPVGGGCRKNKRLNNKQRMSCTELQHRQESGNLTAAISGPSTILDLPPFYNGGQIDLSWFGRTPEGFNLSDDQPSLITSSCSMQGMFGSSRLPSLGIDFPANQCSEKGDHVFSPNGMYSDWKSYQEKDENQGHACNMLRSSVMDSQWMPLHDQTFYGHTAEID